MPFDVLAALLPETTAAEPLRQTLSQFETSPITGIHLWFDRQITDLDHAVLLDRTIQWMFHKSKLLGNAADAEWQLCRAGGQCVEELVEKSRQEIIDLALSELREFFPRRASQPVKSTVIKEVHATYSPRPGVEAIARIRKPCGRACFSPEIGPLPDGPPPWKARSAAAISPPSVSPG